MWHNKPGFDYVASRYETVLHNGVGIKLHGISFYNICSHNLLQHLK